MQALYALECTEDASSDVFEKSLLKSIHSVKDLYLYLLLTVREVANKVEGDAKTKSEKFLPSEADKKFSTKLLSNTIIQYMNHDPEFIQEVKARHLIHHIDENVVTQLYRKLRDAEEYIAYVNSGKEFNFDEDKSIVQYIFENLVLGEEISLHHIEEVFPSWDDDAEFVVGAVREVFKKSKSELKLHTEKEAVQEKFHELIQFSKDLYNKTIAGKESYNSMISPMLKNWEIERVALMDMIIMRMAIAELLEFPSIPVKVTINEYIDVARDYSTPKSKDFVNGILDRLMKNLKAEGQIKKVGRGLLEG
jgi:N utilization substance protein B